MVVVLRSTAASREKPLNPVTSTSACTCVWVSLTVQHTLPGQPYHELKVQANSPSYVDVRPPITHVPGPLARNPYATATSIHDPTSYHIKPSLKKPYHLPRPAK